MAAPLRRERVEDTNGQKDDDPARGIRGQATPEQTESLLEEGIAVMPLPLPDALKGPLQ